jgi:RNA polymerase sigma-70 factor (ECF subfamily)
MDASDRTIIARVVAGDRDRFDDLVRRWDRRVLNLAYRLTGEIEEARDIRQIAFTNAYRALASFNGRSAFSTWIYRIVVNLARDRARSRIALATALRGREQRLPRRRTARPDEESSDREAIRAVATAVAKLPEREREVVVLRHYHDLTFVEIAEIVGAPASTVKSRMDRGLRALRARLASLAT